MNKQQRKEAAIKYIKEHINTRYQKWSSPSLDHHGIEEIRSVSEYNALRAGLCACMVNSLVYYGYSTNYYLGDIIKYVPEFTQENAILLFHGREDSYWWPIGKWWPRYRFMKWLIKEYKE